MRVMRKSACDQFALAVLASSEMEHHMVVCVCNAIKETQVREAARNGATSACQAYRSLGRQPKCGQCVPFARSIIDAERAAA